MLPFENQGFQKKFRKKIQRFNKFRIWWRKTSIKSRPVWLHQTLFSFKREELKRSAAGDKCEKPAKNVDLNFRNSEIQWQRVCLKPLENRSLVYMKCLLWAWSIKTIKTLHADMTGRTTSENDPSGFLMLSFMDQIWFDWIQMNVSLGWNLQSF